MLFYIISGLSALLSLSFPANCSQIPSPGPVSGSAEPWRRGKNPFCLPRGHSEAIVPVIAVIFVAGERAGNKHSRSSGSGIHAFHACVRIAGAAMLVYRAVDKGRRILRPMISPDN